VCVGVLLKRRQFLRLYSERCVTFKLAYSSNRPNALPDNNEPGSVVNSELFLTSYKAVWSVPL